jgi:hypothetical protein
MGDDGGGLLILLAAAMFAAAVYLFFLRSLPCDQICFPAINGIRG